MNYETFAPPPHLKHLVQCFWNLQSREGEAMPEDYFLMADSCTEIIFQYNQGFRNYASQSARMRFQHSLPAQFRVAKRVGFFGVRLYPNAVNLLLKTPASELVNLVNDFTYLFKQDSEELTDRIFNAKCTSDRISLLTQFLSEKTADPNTDPVNFFVEQLIRSNGQQEISDLHRLSGLSVKQFERRFKAVAGFSPKYFARIVRFQSVKSKYNAISSKSMTELAYAHHYYDQSHFNKEFKEFSGVQPLKFFKLLELNTSENPDKNLKPLSFEGYLPCGWFA